MQHDHTRRECWLQFAVVSSLGPLTLLMALLILDRGGLFAVPSAAFAAAGGFLVLVPLVGRATLRYRARRGAKSARMPPWRPLFAAYAAVLLFFAVLLLVTA